MDRCSLVGLATAFALAIASGPARADIAQQELQPKRPMAGTIVDQMKLKLKLIPVPFRRVSEAWPGANAS
jgi:hypothetical protein